MELYAASLPSETRSGQMIVIADQIVAQREVRDGARMKVLGKALEIASQSAGDDMNAAAVHQINARKGMLALRQGDLKEARRKLLSAAFGTPGDARVNLWL